LARLRGYKGWKTSYGEFGGKLPKTLPELIKIPGMQGNSKCNLARALGYNRRNSSGTHITRVSNRLGLTVNQDAVKIEKD